MEKLVGLNFKKEYTIKCINANKHNHATTSYYLLLKKAEQEGLTSEQDFQFFDDKKLSEKQPEVLPPKAEPENLNKTQPIKDIAKY